ncbi:uncharacterized protein LOC108719613 isoform X2 [Xenopus laevis]|uniref:Uncharacterized protein LOC108719613 isoform X2 n=1 Tax=Xenopus laevis TaxID=8355 RepID=A0A8J1MW48_XENLA|nr:uncharacterized protein LOC108719613 isoform X2 [Xenopus laevis]
MCNLMGQLLKLPHFWIKRICLFLAYNYTVVQMVTTSEVHRLTAIKNNIDGIKEIYKQIKQVDYQTSPITLYTAEQDDIRDTCYKAILHCYYLEMKTVVEELLVLKAKDTGEQRLIHLEENLNISPTLNNSNGEPTGDMDIMCRTAGKVGQKTSLNRPGEQNGLCSTQSFFLCFICRDNMLSHCCKV